MAGRHGYTDPTNSQSPAGPTQMGAINAFWDARVGESATNLAAFPVYTARPVGHLIFAEDTGTVYVRAASGWVLLTSVRSAMGALTLTAGWSTNASHLVTRRGALVTANIHLQKSTAISPSSEVPGTVLLSGFRPAQTLAVIGAALVGGNAGAVAGTITTAGVLTVYNPPASNTQCTFHVVFEAA